MNSLKRVNLLDVGHFGNVFFSLSIGLERLLKLILMIDYKNKNGSFPSNKILKDNFSHNIRMLYDRTIEINNEIVKKEANNDYLRDFNSIKNDTLYFSIIEFLSDFALKSRYYNLDVLTNNSERNKANPFEIWQNDIVNEIIKRHHKISQNKAILIDNLSKGVGKFIFVDHTTISGKKVNNMNLFLIKGEQSRTLQKWLSYYMCAIIRGPVRLLHCVEPEESFLYEFFSIFDINEIYYQNKRRWD